MAETFFDTNIVLYLISGDATKADVAAATLAGCRMLYSEDLQAGQRFDGGVVVRNPFER